MSPKKKQRTLFDFKFSRSVTDKTSESTSETLLEVYLLPVENFLK